jgi:hypothetical protein
LDEQSTKPGQAVEVSTDHPLLDALDNRAATYEKLGQLQAALRDGKEMIDMKPRLSKVGSCLFCSTTKLTNYAGVSPVWKNLAIERRARCSSENLREGASEGQDWD